MIEEMPLMSEEEQWRMRIYLAVSHEDGVCHIYGDDGELQCSNFTRHGKCLDFKRDSISELLDNVQMTRMMEYSLKKKRRIE